MFDHLLKFLGSISPEKVGLALAAMVATLFKLWMPALSRMTTRLFVGRAKEIVSIDERERERDVEAEIFTRDAQISRLHAALEYAELERDRFRMLVEALEAEKLELEMAVAEAKIARTRLPPPSGSNRRVEPLRAPRPRDDELDTDRPRSSSRQLPPEDPPPRIPPSSPGRGPRRGRP